MSTTWAERAASDELFVAARLPRPMAALVADRYRAALDFRMPWEGGVLDVHVMYEQKRTQVTAAAR
jgi:predicted 2-oxoglutarate/Fe(II)-dependent dioxygenase YbiX